MLSVDKMTGAVKLTSGRINLLTAQVRPEPLAIPLPPPDPGGGLSNNTNLSAFTVDGNAVTDGQTVNLANGTASVTVVVTPEDPPATVGTITGDTGLSPGGNALSFTVTAADGVTTRDYHLTLHVLTAGAQEITDLNFAGKTPDDLISAGVGTSLLYFDGSDVYGVWFGQGAGGAQPDLSVHGVSVYFPVGWSPGDSMASIMATLGSTFGTMANVSGVAVGPEAVTVTCATGARPDITDVDTGIAINVTQQGANPS